MSDYMELGSTIPSTDLEKKCLLPNITNISIAFTEG